MELATPAATSVALELWHSDYNLNKKHNLQLLPNIPAVFGVFAQVDDHPVNCRYAGVTDRLQMAIADLFEEPPGDALKKFMQGPWIKCLLYEPLTDYSSATGDEALKRWILLYQPGIDHAGDYPGYYA